jgi:flagellar hook-associated protein 3 FlgL
MVKAIHEIRRITVAAANEDYSGSADATYIAQLDEIMKQMVDIANTKHGDEYVFSGTSTQVPPIQVNPGPAPDPAIQPYIYAGNQGVRTTQVLSWVSLPVNIPGCEVFNFDMGSGTPAGADTTDLFTMVKQLRDSIVSKDRVEISSQLSNIDKNLSNVLSNQAQMGSWISRMEGAKTTLADTNIRLREMLSDTEDIDLTEAVVELKSQENVYQTALSITSRMLDLSLASLRFQ